MRSEKKVTNTLLNRAALVLVCVGALLLFIELGLTAYARYDEGGPFAASSHFSGTEAYRFLAIVGLMFTGGMVYSLGRVGRVFGWLTAGVVLWLLYLWYFAFRSFGTGTGLWQVLEFTMMGLVFLSAAWLFAYMPYKFVKNWHGSGVAHPAR